MASNDEGPELDVLPLAAICEAAGVNESLVATLYDEVINEEPETVDLRAVVGLGEDVGTTAGDDEEENESHGLLAVAEEQLDAAFAEAAAEEAREAEGTNDDDDKSATASGGGGESMPLLQNIFPMQDDKSQLQQPPRRRRHVRDVSEDFAAMALQAIHSPEDNLEQGIGQYQHPHGLIPPEQQAKKKPERPHRRSQSAFAYGSGQRTSAAEYRANVLGNLMQKDASFRIKEPGAGNASIPAGGGETNAVEPSALRKFLSPTESFRKVDMPVDGVPQPTRGRVGTWDFATGMPSAGVGQQATHHAAFVILDTGGATGGAESADHGPRRRHRRAHTSVGSGVGVELAAAKTSASHKDQTSSGESHHHRRGHSILPEAIMAPLERGMSILPTIPTSLPSDVDEVKITLDIQEGPKGEVEDVDVLLVVKRSVPIIGYVLLVGASLCLSSTGAVLDKQKGVTPLLKGYWRMSATWLCLLPFALRSLFGSGGGIPKLSRKEWLLFLLCGLGYASTAGFFVLALSLTSVMTTFIFANCHCLLFVLLKIVTGKPISWKEGVGATIGFVGGVVVAIGGKSGGEKGHRFLEEEESASAVPFYLGPLVALLSACGTVLYLSVAKRLRPRCDIWFYTFMQFFVSSWWLLGAMWVSGENFVFSADPHIGLFGWTQPRLDRLVTEMWLVFVCNLGGIMGYLASMKYFEPLVISCCQNVNPILSSVYAVLLGVEPPPTPLALFGDAVVFSGTYLVISAEAKKTEITDVKEVARERGYAITGDDHEKKM